MSLDYDEIAAQALDQIREVGQTRTLFRYGKNYDPVKGSTDSSASLSGPIDFVKLPLGGIRFQEATLVEALTQGRLTKLLIAALSCPFVPDINDVITLDDGYYWHFRKLTPLSPAGTALIYTVIAERGNLAPVDQVAIDITGLELSVAAYEELIETDLSELLIDA